MIGRVVQSIPDSGLRVCMYFTSGTIHRYTTLVFSPERRHEARVTGSQLVKKKDESNAGLYFGVNIKDAQTKPVSKSKAHAQIPQTELISAEAIIYAFTTR